jgi:hypothetical protein
MNQGMANMTVGGQEEFVEQSIYQDGRLISEFFFFLCVLLIL